MSDVTWSASPFGRGVDCDDLNKSARLTPGLGILYDLPYDDREAIGMLVCTCAQCKARKVKYKPTANPLSVLPRDMRYTEREYKR